MPEGNNFAEYESRFIARGNSPEFIERRRVEFDSLIKLFNSAVNYERIVIKQGEYLERVLKKKEII